MIDGISLSKHSDGSWWLKRASRTKPDSFVEVLVATPRSDLADRLQHFQQFCFTEMFQREPRDPNQLPLPFKPQES